MIPDFSPETIRSAVDRILASETFRGAERSRTLLKFVVDEAVQGRADRLKDYVLGAEALGRGEQFDPRTDPIARVEASRLRSRLDVYYASEGATDPVRISLPKGGYAPAFERRTAEAQPVTATVRRPPSMIPIAAATFFVAVIAAIIGWQFGRGAVPADTTSHLDLVTPATTDSISFAISPDGLSVVFVASTDSRSRLWLRALESNETRPLAGTEYAVLPFWSPDNRSIGFFADGRVKRFDLEAGLVKTISTAIVPAGAAWNQAGVILHPIVPDSPLFRTTSDGGPLEMATEPIPGQVGHRGPAFLPDGKRFLFHANGAPQVSGIYVGQLGTRSIMRLVEADAPAVVAPPDHILYVRDKVLFRHRIAITPDSVSLAGSPERIAEDISVDSLFSVAAVSASSDVILYRTGSPAGKRQFRWIGRDGIELSSIGSPEARAGAQVSVSPDFKQLAFQRTTAGNTDIVIMDAVRGTSYPLTNSPLPEIAPHFSPTNDRIIYSAIQDGFFQLFEKPLGREPTLLFSSPKMKQITDWSRDDKYILFRTVDFMPVPDIDVWAFARDGDGHPFPVIQTPFEERDAQFSPDGKFVAYQSNSSGRYEIYVKPFLETAEPYPISKDGGVQVRWQDDGRGLYYLNLAGELTFVPISRERDGSLKAGTAETLFRANVGPLQTIATQSYKPSKDNTKFLMDVIIEEVPAPIRVILNWKRW